VFLNGALPPGFLVVATFAPSGARWVMSFDRTMRA